MNQHNIEQDVMKAIRGGAIKMRPRWHFVLLSVLSVLGVFIMILTLLYVASLALFFLRDSGAWYAASLGGRGWFTLLHSLPWLLILLIVAFIVVLELLVRRYAFVYKKPLVNSVLAIIALIFIGGFGIASTPLHHSIEVLVRHGDVPPPIGDVYGALRQPPPGDMYHGAILATSTHGFFLRDEDRGGTTTIIITRKTRLPYGESFEAGERVVVVGDMISTGTVQAFGIREIDEYPDSDMPRIPAPVK